MDVNNAAVHLSTTRQLFPINNDIVNFHSEFHVVSENKQPFRALILSQSELDSLSESAPLAWKDVPKGIFAGTITENSNKKDDWYIALEADKPMAAEVSVRTVPIPAEGAVPPAPPAQDTGPVSSPPKKGGMTLWLILLIIAAVLLAGYLGYKYFFGARATVIVPSPAIAPAAAASVAAPIVVEDPVPIDVSDLPEL